MINNNFAKCAILNPNKIESPTNWRSGIKIINTTAFSPDRIYAKFNVHFRGEIEETIFIADSKSTEIYLVLGAYIRLVFSINKNNEKEYVFTVWADGGESYYNEIKIELEEILFLKMPNTQVNEVK